MRIVFMMRNPIERDWSDSIHILTRKKNKRSVEAVPIEEFRRMLNDPWMYRNSDYLKIIDTWYSVFPKEQILLMFYDELSANPQQYLTKIFDHIGVTTDVDWSAFPYNKRYNVNPPKEIPPELLEILRARYCPVIEELYQRFGDDIAAWRC